MLDEIAARFPYWALAVLLAVGLYGIIGKRSLVKKLIGLNIFQVSIILFFIAGSVKTDATVPITKHGEHAVAAYFVNPLPHVLMLTAIVVAVAVTGLALSFLVRLYREFPDLDEEQILEDLGRPS